MEVQDPADARRRGRKARQKFPHDEVDPILDLLTCTGNDTLHSPPNLIVFILNNQVNDTRVYRYTYSLDFAHIIVTTYPRPYLL